jgi:hypothetical protein
MPVKNERAKVTTHQPYVERALFVIGNPGDGKTTHLNLIRDNYLFQYVRNIRLKPVRRVYAISNERLLYVRSRSPHEDGKVVTLPDYFRDIERDIAIQEATHIHTQIAAKVRWNFAGALWRTAAKAGKKVPIAEDCVAQFAAHFHPERIRLVVLFDGFQSDLRGSRASIRMLNHRRLASISSPVEILYLRATYESARSKNNRWLMKSNRHFIADYFDFT